MTSDGGGAVVVGSPGRLGSPAIEGSATTMGGAVAERRPPNDHDGEDPSVLAERNERARVERLRADAGRPPEALLGDTLRLAKFLTGVAEGARRGGDVRS